MKVLEYNSEEEQALLQLIDAGIRQLGINGAKNATYWINKLERAKEKEPVTDVSEE